MKGLVLKKNANLFSVEEISTGKVFHLPASGKTQNSGVYVGDYVNFNENIEKIESRKNLLIRPPLANLDTMFIVIACVPKPDLTLIDKMIVYCFVKGIKPVLVVNKIDKCDKTFVEEIKKISQLIVHPQKKQAEYKRYLPDGTIEKVVSEDGVRTYYEKKPHSKQYVRRKELNNGVPNMIHWFMNVFDNEGNFVKQIIQGVKGSPFERR